MESGLAGGDYYQNLMKQINAPRFQPQAPTYSQSLATPQLQTPGGYPSMDTRMSQGKGGTQLAPGAVDPAMNGLAEQRTFFDQDATHLDNIGALGNLAVSGLGLVGMFKNLKAQDQNYEMAKESMAQQTAAYNDRKDSVARSRAAVTAANQAYA